MLLLLLLLFLIRCVHIVSIDELAVRGDRLLLELGRFFSRLDVAPEIHVTFDGAAWNYQVRIAFRIDGTYVVVELLGSSVGSDL